MAQVREDLALPPKVMSIISAWHVDASERLMKKISINSCTMNH